MLNFYSPTLGGGRQGKSDQCGFGESARGTVGRSALTPRDLSQQSHFKMSWFHYYVLLSIV